MISSLVNIPYPLILRGEKGPLFESTEAMHKGRQSGTRKITNAARERRAKGMDEGRTESGNCPAACGFREKK
jgi:hypothetical protein